MIFVLFVGLLGTSEKQKQGQFDSDVKVAFPLVLMVTSLLGLLMVFGYHLRRIMKEIATEAPTFEPAEAETRIVFTTGEAKSNQEKS